MRNQKQLFSYLTFLLGGGLLWGQGFKAEVLGTVSDKSGAVIPQAVVTAVNTGTGQKIAVATDNGGNYIIPKLTPGVYNIAVEMQGFKRGVRDALKLDVDQRQPLDFKLEVGEVSDSVAVTSEAAQIQSETATVGGVVNHDSAVELPLNGRNFLQLNLLVPGAAQP